MSTHITRRRFAALAGAGGLALGGSGLASARRPGTVYRAHLSGDEEVPPVDTRAQGQVIVATNADETALSYKLIVANIENVVAAHIHCAPAGSNGPVGVTLFSGGPTSQSGVLAADTVTGPDDGNGCGWVDIGDVVAAIEAGEAYVNVHTPANPPGEIRGQLG